MNNKITTGQMYQQWELMNQKLDALDQKINGIIDGSTPANTQLTGRKVEQIYIENARELWNQTSQTNTTQTLYRNELDKFKFINYFITNTLKDSNGDEVVLKIELRPFDQTFASVEMEDGTFENYGGATARVNYKIPNVNSLPLTSVHPTNGDGKKTKKKSPFLDYVGTNGMRMMLSTDVPATSGTITIIQVGVIN